MCKIICNVAEAKKKFYDYRSILDYIYSQLMQAECEYVAQNSRSLRLFYICNIKTSSWIQKLIMIGSFKNKKEIVYDGFCENCIGILNGHEVLLNNDLEDDRIYISCQENLDDNFNQVYVLLLND